MIYCQGNIGVAADRISILENIKAHFGYLNVLVNNAGIMAQFPETGAILLECSDMPPYAYAVQAATKLPVFDFTTLIRWMQTSVCQTPYHGFI